MKRTVPIAATTACILALAVIGSRLPAEDKPGKAAPTSQAVKPVVVMETSKGTIKIELWPQKTPITVKNFLRYTDEKFYDKTVFHRVIKGFMIQGGGFTADMKQKATHDPIKNEASAELKNLRGTIAMARTGIVDSATSQFFINHADNKFLNHRDKTPRGYGYCVFGKVIEGMKVVDAIAAVRTGTKAGMGNVPVETVTILSVRRQVPNKPPEK